ncbi:hypothetical protein GCM10023187_13770 [Nibrella viscosa]|uniref:DUF306 domain-containing protein n=1 Tax=Nibrella viscosa TaxID=1084524 RepID=A0ABP8K5U5_9BACT
MAWKFGGIYLKNDFGGDPVLALNRLGIDKRFTDERVRFSTVIDSTFEPTAIGIVGSVTLVHDNRLPYNHSYEADTVYPADERLLLLSHEVESLVFYLDGITDSYGLAHFQGGRRVRHFSMQRGDLIVQEGEMTTIHTSSVEAQLLDWLQAFTGLSFTQLVLDDHPIMYVFTETGF